LDSFLDVIKGDVLEVGLQFSGNHHVIQWCKGNATRAEFATVTRNRADAEFLTAAFTKRLNMEYNVKQANRYINEVIK